MRPKAKTMTGRRRALLVLHVDPPLTWQHERAHDLTGGLGVADCHGGQRRSAPGQTVVDVDPYGLRPDYNEHLTVNSAEIMQFTGLTDKNGIEIYESDIVGYSGNGGSFNAVVRFGDYIGGEEDKGYGYYLERRTELLGLSAWGTQRHLEVIGNIYENPEMLA